MIESLNKLREAASEYEAARYRDSTWSRREGLAKAHADADIALRRAAVEYVCDLILTSRAGTLWGIVDKIRGLAP